MIDLARNSTTALQITSTVIKPSPHVRIVVDTREQEPYEFPHIERTLVRKALVTGDYSIDGYEALIAVERKSENDFLQSITHRHDEFFDEVYRLSRIPGAMIVVESDLQRFLYHKYPRRITIESVLGNITSIEADFGVRLKFLSDRPCAQTYVGNLLSKLAVKLGAVRGA